MRFRGIILSLLLLSVGLAGCVDRPDASTSLSEGFEDGLGAWAMDSQVPDDPNRPGQKVGWNITASSDQVHAGQASALYELDGSQDDGTIWLERSVEIRPGQAYEARGSAWAWSPSESFNTRAHLVVSLAYEDPDVEEDFPPPGENTSLGDEADRGGLRQDLDRVEGWDRYTFGWDVPARDTGEVHVAIGVSAVWETHLEFYVDEIEIELTPT